MIQTMHEKCHRPMSPMRSKRGQTKFGNYVQREDLNLNESQLTVPSQMVRRSSQKCKDSRSIHPSEGDDDMSTSAGSESENSRRSKETNGDASNRKGSKEINGGDVRNRKLSERRGFRGDALSCFGSQVSFKIVRWDKLQAPRTSPR